MSAGGDLVKHGAIRCAFLVVALLACPVPAAMAQAESDPAADASAEDAAPDAAAAETEPDIDEAALLGEDELDDLVAPAALYPDALLAQVFVASTYPLDVVKASQWVGRNEDMPEGDRADAAEAEGWDPSVAVLAAGFPSVIEAMAGDLDRTELLGDAMLTQSDDVLEAVQRMRAQADAMGNLPSNEAQTVTVEGDNISIAPTQPEVVYVPTYDSQAVYTTPAPAAAPAAPTVVDTTGTSYPTTSTVVVDDNDGFSTGAMVTTGLLSFGAGMLVNEVFNDNDWGGYWGRSYGPPIGWGGGGYVRPYPPGWRGGNNDINVNFDRNIDARFNRIDRNGDWRPDRASRDRARNSIAKRKGVSTRSGTRPGRTDGGRAALKQKMDAKGGGARGRENLLANRQNVRGKIGDRAGGGGKLANRAGAKNVAKRPGGGKLAKRKPGKKGSAFGKDSRNLTGAKRAANRGKISTARAGGKGGAGLRAGGGGGKKLSRAGGGRKKLANAGGGGRKATRKGTRNGSAFKKGSGRQAHAGKARGAKSRGGGRRGGKRR